MKVTTQLLFRWAKPFIVVAQKPPPEVPASVAFRNRLAGARSAVPYMRHRNLAVAHPFVMCL